MPRASISALPAEIKAKIVEMCAAQDEVLKKQVARLEAVDTANALLPDTDGTWAPYSSTVHAVSAVSREWCSLAGPYRFPLLTARQLDSLTFRLSFGKRHGSRVIGVDLDDLVEVTVSSVVASLALLPNLRHCTVPDRTIFGVALRRELDPSTADAEEAETLAVDGVKEAIAGVGSIKFVSVEDLRVLCPKSRTLARATVQPILPKEITALLDLKGSDYPNLRRLSIEIDEGANPDQIFEDYRGPPIGSIVSLKDAARVILESISPDNLPALRRLHIAPINNALYTPHVELRTTLLKLAEAYHTALSATLEITFVSPGDTDDRRWVFTRDVAEADVDADSQSALSICESRVRRVPAMPALLFKDPGYVREGASAVESETREEIGMYVNSNISNVTRAMDDMAKQAEVAGDLVQLTRIAEALQRCEYLRLEREA
ncbi:hypothetical protein BMF94_3369 [Rhodotorula taiwanensis]|uniref:Uncharacterized protein n=1 Tax=Rhodotorula taiwanensis TaxID=741276 RepID=A0A2S5BAN9_9BASI|nr:hypothetical protein BMF94_3369 [Rhodotorula taiwanensis]